MKKILFSLAALAALSLVAVGCNNASGGAKGKGTQQQGGGSGGSSGNDKNKDEKELTAAKNEKKQAIEQLKTAFEKGTADVLKFSTSKVDDAANKDQLKGKKGTAGAVCCLQSEYDAEIAKFKAKVAEVEKAGDKKAVEGVSTDNLPKADTFKGSAKKVIDTLRLVEGRAVFKAFDAVVAAAKDAVPASGGKVVKEKANALHTAVQNFVGALTEIKADCGSIKDVATHCTQLKAQKESGDNEDFLKEKANAVDANDDGTKLKAVYEATSVSDPTPKNTCEVGKLKAKIDQIKAAAPYNM